jgi:hypothetical protein
MRREGYFPAEPLGPLVPTGRSGIYKTQDSKDGDDVDGQKVDRLCALLEKLLEQRGAGSEEEAEDEDPESQYERAGSSEQRAPKPLGRSDLVPITTEGGEGNVNPLSARDARAALQHLRNLRGFIEATGDRKAKDAYNSAIETIKAQVALAEKFNPRASSAYDSKSSRKAESVDFEARAARFHGKAIKLHSDVNAVEDEHRAEDAQQPEESFEETAARYGREAQARFMPKRRR